MTSRIKTVLAQNGLSGVGLAVARRLLRSRAPAFDAAQPMFQGQSGIEIGGPSALFARGGLFPVYPELGSLDNVNFSSDTVWEGDRGQGDSFVFDPAKPAGTQFLREASDLGGLPSGRYDVLLASHVIEHLANPLGALREWARVVRPGGLVVLVVPHRDGTFDHRRPVTTLEHLDDDFNLGTTEDDLTHLPEILALHDLRRDPGAGTGEAFRSRSGQNAQYRCLHHHVFDTRLVVRVVGRVGWEVVAVSAVRPYHIFLVARTSVDGVPPDNTRWLAPGAPALVRSPFRSDREA